MSALDIKNIFTESRDVGKTIKGFIFNLNIKY